MDLLQAHGRVRDEVLFDLHGNSEVGVGKDTSRGSEVEDLDLGGLTR